MVPALLRALLSVALVAALCLPALGFDESVSHAQRELFHLRDVVPSGESWIEQWLGQPGMLGDWGGLRPALARLGITPTVTWVSDVQGNPIGGQRQGLREFDNLDVEVDVDLAALLGAPGTRLHVGMSQRSGTSLTDIDIGNVFNVAQVCCGATFRLVDVFLEQPMLDNRVKISLGRMSAGDDFLTSPLYWLFVSTGINGNPVGALIDAPGLTAYPTATWGLKVRVKLLEQLVVRAGVYNGDPTLGENAKHGVDWTLRGPLFAIGEIGYRHNQGAGATGLPGNYKIGAYYNGGPFTDFLGDTQGGLAPLTGLPARTVQGNAGFYILVDQMVYREGGAGSQRGLTPFAALVVAPNQSINTLPIFVDAGLVYQGLIPGRDNDVAGFGFVWGSFSRDLRQAQRLMREAGVATPVQDYELVLEWTYAIQMARWLRVQPDVQYIIKPGGSSIPNALVIGAQIGMTF